ncbi:hypothetical protein [Sphingomonas rubra]|uniref:Uncharacterized protein n=1 Tax=Sphingomonas rubra TaxID=634430 RepID=A0A1I5SHZ1_9SPHN|nr:hypothetical protein [Sphingomonas rubra]SFP70355.1 hypothetical protein SAMN04488241_105244 [Sphingomonas rubra]
MIRAGRPLQFLAMALGGWTIARVALLWPTIDTLPDLVRAIAPPVAAATRPPGAIAAAPVAAGRRERSRIAAVHRSEPRPDKPPVQPQRIVVSSAPAAAVGIEPSSPPRQPPPLRPAPLATPPDRWAGSAWLIARGGRADALANGQLGASQAGARVTYALGHRVALAARLSAPFAGRGAEVALGFDWQPTRAPIHLVAEQRLAIDGGRGGTTLMAIGGLDPTPVALGFSVDAYGQAGGIRRRDGVIGFVDGAARIARTVARRGSTRVELGAGAWGGAQPGAARLDLGPSAALVTPIAGRAVRLSLDWRQRVAGRARPGSGPALSIGGDF